MLTLFVSSLLAGLCIGIGAAAFCLCGNAIIGALLFSGGLSVICARGWTLYTGRIGYSRTKKDYQEAALMLIGNCIGIAITALILRAAVPTIQVPAIAIVAAKNRATITQKFCSGIACGMCVYLAVDGYRMMKNFLFILLFIPIFIVCTWDHCIANVAYAIFAGQLIRLDLFAAMILGNSIGALGINWLSQLCESK